jgi:hypothetical protein
MRRNLVIFLTLALLLSGCSSSSDSDLDNSVGILASGDMRDTDYTETALGDAYELLQANASRTSTEYLAPVLDFIENKNCSIDFMWVKFPYSYGDIEGNPEMMMKDPQKYRFASDVHQAVHLVLSYAKSLSGAKNDVAVAGEGASFGKEYRDQYKAYINRIQTLTKSLCDTEGNLITNDFTKAVSVRQQLLNPSYRQSFNEFLDLMYDLREISEDIDRRYPDNPDNPVIFCEEKETTLNGFSLIKCYP